MPANLGPAPGLDRNKVKTNSEIDQLRGSREWDQLANTAEDLGPCRKQWPAGPCQGRMFAVKRQPYQTDEDRIYDQDAECNVCHSTVAAPNGRALGRSSRHTEMPNGYWEGRTRRMSTQPET